MSKTLNTLFAVGGSRLYDTPEDAEKALVSIGFLKESNNTLRLYPDESEVDEDFRSGWVQAEIRLMYHCCEFKYYLTFEFMI